MAKAEKEYSKLQWFFFVILIPSIFAIILFSIILSFLGFNVVEKAKETAGKLPFVGEYFIEEEEEEVNLEELYAQLADQQEQIERLELTITQKDEAIIQLENELIEMAEQAEVEQVLEETVATPQPDLKEIAKTYEAMSAKNAANILTELPVDEALLHMSQISTQVRAQILAKMDSDRAADIMSRLANQ